MRQCGVCKTVKSLDSFVKNKECRQGRAGTCKQCHLIKTKQWKSRNQERAIEFERKSLLKTKYGITPEKYKEMLELQNNVCAICGKGETKKGLGNLCVDHCHSTGKIRELLCRRCNSAIGQFEENVSYLESAINYLKKHKK